MMKIIDMRTKFFFFSTLIIVALIPAAPKDLMFVPEYTAITYCVLTVLCLFDSVFRHNSN